MRLLAVVLGMALVSLHHTPWVGAQTCNVVGRTQVHGSCCSQPTSFCCSTGTGQCFCDLNTQPSACSAYHVNASDVSQCCGTLQKLTFQQCYFYGVCLSPSYKYQYLPTRLESVGLCSRLNGVPRSSWYTQMEQLPNPLPGGCYCKAEATTCVTTTAAKLLCPTAPSSSFARLLGGTPVDTCSAHGVMAFQRSGNNLVCNGVLGFNPAKNANEIYLSEFCRGFMAAMVGSGVTLTGYNPEKFTPPSFTTSTSLGSSAIRIVAPPAGYLTSLKCKTSACVFNKATMGGSVDTSNCYVNSLGYHITAGGTPSSTLSTQQLKVSKKTTCTTTPTTTGAECFAATDTNARVCPGDSGAPVFCPLTTTKETVLYGLLDNLNPAGGCSGSNELHVLAIP